MFTILIVDDEQAALDAHRRTFHGMNWTVLEALSGEEAVSILHDQPVDLVLTDESMHGMRGTDLLVLLRERYPDVARILLTGQSDIAMAQRAINDGKVDQLLLKPVPTELLRDAVHDALLYRELTRESTRLLGLMKRQQAFLDGFDYEPTDIGDEADDARLHVVGRQAVIRLLAQIKHMAHKVESHWRRLAGKDAEPPD